MTATTVGTTEPNKPNKKNIIKMRRRNGKTIAAAKKKAHPNTKWHDPKAARNWREWCLFIRKAYLHGIGTEMTEGGLKKI